MLFLPLLFRGSFAYDMLILFFFLVVLMINLTRLAEVTLFSDFSFI